MVSVAATTFSPEDDITTTKKKHRVHYKAKPTHMEPMSSQFLGNFSDCDEIRKVATANSGRYLRHESGVHLNVKPNTGALDRSALCIFSREGPCAKSTDATVPHPSSVQVQRAMQRYKVEKVQGCVRSVEKAVESKRQQQRSAEAARCNAMLKREC